MDASLPRYVEQDPVRVRPLAATRELWVEALAAEEARSANEATLAWRSARGGDRLIRTGPASRADRRRTEEDLGVRGPATEAAWERHRAAVAEAGRLTAISRASLAVQAAANLAAGLGRIPASAGSLLRRLRMAGLLGPGCRVSSSGALLAYEAAWGGRLLVPGPDPFEPLRGTLRLLCRDDCLRRVEGAVIAEGFMKTGVRGRYLDAASYIVDLERPVEAEGLMRGPCVDALAVADDGLPVPLSAPPVQAFVAARLRAASDGAGDAAFDLALARCAVACTVLADGRQGPADGVAERHEGRVRADRPVEGGARETRRRRMARGG